MKTTELIDKKIKDLNDALEGLKTSGLDDKQRFEAKLVILNECEKVLNNEELLSSFNFDDLIKLLKEENLMIDNLEKILSDIKQVIDIKKQLGMEIPYAKLQIKALEKLKENIKLAKTSIKTKLKDLESKTVEKKQKEKIETLEQLKNILNGEGKRKYYTDEMIDAFYGIIDWKNLPDEDFENVINSFYETKNLKRKRIKQKEKIENVIALYKEFLDEMEFTVSKDEQFTGLFGALIKEYEDEICSFIDIDNTREILSFFKEKEILQKFGRTALLKISLFAKSSYVKKIYLKLLKEKPEEIDVYFEDELATTWICDSRFSRRNPFRVSRKNDSPNSLIKTLYSQCHSVTYDEFNDNIEYLSNHADMFEDENIVRNIGSHLKLKTKPTEELRKTRSLLSLLTSSSWAFRKNMELIKIFGMSSITKIPITSLESGDIENKIHLAIELGLLNPPMSSVFNDMEKEIFKNDEFQKMQKKRRIVNHSIRNYFQRYLSVLSSLTVNEYIYLLYKHQSLGSVDFYNEFFSKKRAGMRSLNYLTHSEKMVTKNKEQMDRLISQNFITEFYPDFVENYNEYDVIISNHDEKSKSTFGLNDDYYDPSILSDKLIVSLEENNTVDDEIIENNEKKLVKNNYVYLFGNTIISRYKVLHNASILRAKYGYLDENKLLASIVRHSYISEEAFLNIEKTVRERIVNL